MTGISRDRLTPTIRGYAGTVSAQPSSTRQRLPVRVRSPYAPGMPACASCGAESPDGFRFCGACGSPLAAPAAPLPEERKVVSALFCDLVGFTATSEGADPEDVDRMLTAYFAMARAPDRGARRGGREVHRRCRGRGVRGAGGARGRSRAGGPRRAPDLRGRVRAPDARRSSPCASGWGSTPARCSSGSAWPRARASGSSPATRSIPRPGSSRSRRRWASRSASRRTRRRRPSSTTRSCRPRR